mgnify:CR=1 FL=1
MKLLTPAGYEQTKTKLNRLEQRLQQLEQRRDLSEIHMSEVRRSYEQMMGQYRQEMRLFEAETGKKHPIATAVNGTSQAD